jgi:3-oxoacyl-[acyl-carrier protein] reductase
VRFARVLHAVGAQVAISARRADRLEALAAELPGVLAVPGDVGIAKDREHLVATVEKHFGRIDVLVNNAGITRDTLMLRMKDDDWDRVLDVNLKGAFITARTIAKPMMKARYGRIINITSVIGLHGGAGQANYAAAKAGLIGLTMTIAKEFGSRGITCNAVAPGFIESDMTEALPQEFKDDVVKRAPAGRLGTPADIAPAVLFLASADAAYVTGQTLTVDGGLFL